MAAWVALAAVAVVIIPAVQPVGVAHAQNLGQRNVAGLVIDANSAPVQGATVFLKNQKTKSIRSYTSSSNGSFRFAQVGMTDDYDLWAEKDGKKSPTKTVSSWDARKDFETELKLK
ncbi:MAG: carboxypeptidase-like regulatory domain-containing protein [Terracidiphilus sp.]